MSQHQDRKTNCCNSMPTNRSSKMILIKEKSRQLNVRSVRRRPKIMILLTIAVSAIIVALILPTQFAFGQSTATKLNAIKSVTQAYSEPMSWTFGGWAPLNGKPASENSAKTSSNSKTPVPGTTPRPRAQIHLLNSTIHSNNRTNRVELMNESASDSHEKVQFASPDNRIQAPNGNSIKMSVMNQQLHQGPAYNIQTPNQQSSGNRPQLSAPNSQQFSPPAPAPIVRDQLIPSANQHQVRHSQPDVQHHQMVHMHQMHQPSHFQKYSRPMMHQKAIRHHQPHPAMSQLMAQHQHAKFPMHQMGDDVSFRHYQQMQQRHRQQMMHHHMMMQNFHRPGPMNSVARPPYNMENQRLPMQHQSYQQNPNRRPMAHPEQPRVMQQQMHSRPPPIQYPQDQHREPQLSDTFKVIRGEQPVIFSHSIANDRIPVLEINGLTQSGNGSAQLPSGQTLPVEQLYQPNLATNEKENLNYQNALKQVTYVEDQAQQQYPSNNIQDIKEKQHHQQQTSADKTSDSKPSHLTIPVAVETEGDKVLTPEDINEIEKHVINVLPNLKTAKNIVNLADTHLKVAQIKLPSEVPNAPMEQQAHNDNHEQTNGPKIHEQHYQEHRSTMKQLENDFRPNDHSTGAGQAQQVSTETSVGYSSGSASTANAQQEEAPVGHHQEKHQPEHLEPDYYVATGPLQEVSPADPEQISEFNLIKNDLLNTLSYEPTRSRGNSGQEQRQSSYSNTTPMMTTQELKQHHHHQQTASTPPIPFAVNISSNDYQHQANFRGPSVSRYFQHGRPSTMSDTNENQYSGHSQNPKHQHGNSRHHGLFGRIRHPAGTSTTKTILGGRKVSEVMRPLIHTTPVPMTSPMHVASVEPEKVDAIQLIAGQANDRQPMVVESHQLVSHTPDGGIDYNSGAQLHLMQSNHRAQGSNQSLVFHDQKQDQQQHQQQQSEYQSPVNDNQGAIIEYVTIGEPSSSPANSHHSDSGSRQAYEISNQIVAEPVYMSSAAPGDSADRGQQSAAQNEENTRPALSYDYAMTGQPQGFSDSGETGSPAYGNPGESSYSSSVDQQVPRHQADGQPSLAWSPSVASEHQMQQIELSGHAAPTQQMGMPSTAGYNFFTVSSEPRQEPPSSQQYEQQQDQNHEPALAPDSRWMTKAGGHQPNPDAQYDGQIAKSESEGENQNSQQGERNGETENQQANYNEQQDLGRLNSPNQNSRPIQENRANQQEADEYQQQQVRDGNFFGHEQNAQTPPNVNYGNQEQHQMYTIEPKSSTNGQQYEYAKLDHDRQETHLAQHQAQHQAELAEMMDKRQQVYQTTTPMTLTTTESSLVEQQHQQELSGADGNINANNGYLQSEEQVQSRPSVQSQPESLLVNESPVQVPILDQQSLIPDSSQDSTGDEINDDDGAKQSQHSQPAGVYQVYQAYYAPKEHKPLPGYVRLSLEEFNELFRDAEIQYVDKNQNSARPNGQQGSPMQTPLTETNSIAGNYRNEGQESGDQMRSAASDVQSILVDGRSLTAVNSDRRSPTDSMPTGDKNSTIPSAEASKFNGKDKAKSASSLKSQTSNGKPIESMGLDGKLKLGRAVKKIISIRNARQLVTKQTPASAKQQKQTKNSNIKRVKTDKISSSLMGLGASTMKSVITSSPPTKPTKPTSQPTTGKRSYEVINGGEKREQEIQKQKQKPPVKKSSSVVGPSSSLPSSSSTATTAVVPAKTA